MDKIIFVMGVLAILEGVASIVKPDLYRKVIAIFTKGKMPWFAALLTVVFGVILLMAVTRCNEQMQWLILTTGVAFCIGGTAMFFVSQAKVKSFFVWFSSRGNWFYKALGLIAIALGSLLIYSI